MDEFQRFKDLLTEENETKLLIDILLKSKNTKVLLLSATPYKLYSTIEEVSQSNCESEHFKEFDKVFEFLQEKEEDRDKEKFRNSWKEYVTLFSRFCSNKKAKISESIKNAKNKAQTELYKYMSRTERIGSLVQRQDKASINIKKSDIVEYIEIENLLNKLDLGDCNIDYVKSTPFPLSFMSTTNYTICDKIREKIKELNITIKDKEANHLFVDRNRIKNYESIYEDHYRLNYLIDNIFGKEHNVNKYGPEFLLWVPASKPYYKVNDKVFSKNKLFSKTIIFSRWAMVPRMIATMTSYETSRRLVEKNDEIKALFSKKKIDQAIRKNSNNGNETGTYKLLTNCSKFLTECYKPLGEIGQEKNINKLLKEIIDKIKQKLKRDGFDISEPKENKRVTNGNIIDVLNILDNIKNPKEKKLEVPNKVFDILAMLAIASPAICAYRIFNDEELAKELAEGFISLFNRRDSQVILKVLYKDPNMSYFEKVIRYCVDGNLQAVLDEYSYILGGEAEKLKDKMLEGFGSDSSLELETKDSFVSDDKAKRISMRCDFGVGYYNAKMDDKNINRTNNIRNYFNSPFRPFILATTSIGQEGLDFHNYSSKIVHWNLPHNPIDLEQREGRINRYMCHAIRLNIASEKKYYKEKFKKNFWKELMERATKDLKRKNSDLVPYWCLPEDKNKKYKVHIERYLPLYPFSFDQIKYEKLMDVLKLYRLTIGQSNQEEIVNTLREKKMKQKDINELCMNLSPWYNRK